MDLRFGTAMSHRPQQTRINSGQSCQLPSIEPIVVSTTLADQSHVPRMSHQICFEPALEQRKRTILAVNLSAEKYVFLSGT
jgi:hypothetical protein